MKPSRYASGERISDAFSLNVHYPAVPFSRLYSEPEREYKHSVNITYNHFVAVFEDSPFRSPALMKTMGDFINLLNKFFDKNNQVMLFIPHPDETKIILYADQNSTMNNVRDRIIEMFEDYAETNMKRIHFIKYIDLFVKTEKTRRAKEKQLANLTPRFKISATDRTLSRETLVERYLQGVNKELLAYEPESLSSFEFKFPLIKHDFSEPGDTAAKILEKENLHEERHRSYLKLKTFLHHKLNVTLSIHWAYPRTVTIRGTTEDVFLADNIGKRAASLINENKTISNKFLDDALADAKKDAIIARTCEVISLDKLDKQKKPLRLRSPG